MTAKERREEKRRLAAAPLLTVWADALVQHEGGATESRPVRLWDNLPPWWAKAEADQRGTWLKAFFAKQLHLEATSKVLTVTCGRTGEKSL